MEDLGEKCGVFGVYGKGLDVSRLTFFGLYALQHRGQESSGIAVSDGANIRIHKDEGLVAQVFSEEHIERLKGHVAIGHNRYSTAGGSKKEHVQPILVAEDRIALAHNGNLPSTTALVEFLGARGISIPGASDSRLAAEAIGVYAREGMPLRESVKKVYPLLTGAFSILVMDRGSLIAIRDHCGIRPLALGRLNGGYIVASETCALHPVGASFEREIEPGEMVVIDENGISSEKLAAADPKFDVFEFVYFARPDSDMLGRSVYEVRKQCGAHLARERIIEADVVIPVPETATPAALGYSRVSGIPLETGLIKNRYIHRTFIQPEQHLREQGVRAKLTPLPGAIRGKRVVVIDDSIVRGTTSRQIVRMLFETGASEVHFLSSSPPVRFPDFYGIDTPRQENLLAASRSVEEMREYLGATSLYFLSLEGMIEAIGVPESRLNTSCFTGVYPIDIKERSSEVSWAPVRSALPATQTRHVKAKEKTRS